MGALRDAGVAVPRDMSVVSFDEDECLAFLEVPVTSVCMPLAELGTAAVDALIARIEGEPATDVMIREPMALQLRGSVAVPPGVVPPGRVPAPRPEGPARPPRSPRRSPGRTSAP
jgi:LacI family transcriptional regulator